MRAAKDEFVWGTSDRGDPAALASVRDLYAGTLFPDEQIETCRNSERLFPTRTVRRGDRPVSRLPVRQEPFPDLSFESVGKSCDLYDYVSRNRTASLLILKDGQIAFERHQFGNTPRTRWMSMSMAKSFSATLVGAAIQDGLIGGLEDLLTDYLPELRGTSYEGVSVRALLQMSSGVFWTEDQTDPNSTRRAMLELQIGQQPGTILDYMGRLPRVHPPGQVFTYSTGETHVVGALLRAAVGKSLAQYLSEKFWSRLGMEQDAEWWLESPDGLEVAGSGLTATLRDYARFGLFVLAGGVIDGERILPEGWVKEATSPRVLGGQPVNYGFMWWPQPSRAGTFEDGAFRAGGIFGQYLYVNPAHRVVIAVWSARSKPLGADAIPDIDFFNAVVEALK
ncbi:serine hydrolase domain-containing protein [Caulobacter sp. LjRoot300]|uniref:serine hydrolase domain-containing protein n=1 Tax=Caulobacter sp. LjRoot300 TaxID=3342321 RepID=UPI003ECF464E